MKSTFQDLQAFITSELLLAYQKRTTETLLFRALLRSILKKYNLTFLQSNVGYEVRGENGYNTITDMLYILKRMSNMGIILYHTQGKPSTTLDDMDYSNPELHPSGLKITEDFAEYLKECVGKSIWISPEIENFAVNGYVSEELAIARKQMQEAKRQSCWARCTLCCSVISILISIITLLISILSLCPHCC